jgi:hypothetical protein
MRFHCGPSRAEKIAAKEKWHLHFALWPRRVGPRECVWLDYVWRRGLYSSYGGDACWVWTYRAGGDTPGAEATVTRTESPANLDDWVFDPTPGPYRMNWTVSAKDVEAK